MDLKTRLRGIVRCKLLKKKKLYKEYTENDNKHNFYPRQIYIKHLNSHEWPRQNFRLQYQHDIKQKSDENEENINWGNVSWFNTKISEVTSWEWYSRE